MSSKIRKLTYSLAINEALHQAMGADPRVMLIGQGVKSPWYVGNTARGLVERFGELRVIDTPVSENAVTGAAVGASLAGAPTIVVHPRMDFMVYALDPIINEAANWYYMNGGRSSVPVVFWGIINRGGEQAAQHAQSLHALFSHIPGLKVVMPATPYDAKGLMLAAIRDPNPVVFIDDRWLYGLKGHVPEKPYTVEIGKGEVVRRGRDVTVTAISYLVPEALKAAEELSRQGIESEVIDLKSAKPLDAQLVLSSLRRTGRLVACDVAWRTGGLSAEVAAIAADSGFGALRAPIARVSIPDVPAPSSRALEAVYFPRSAEVAAAIRRTVSWKA